MNRKERRGQAKQQGLDWRANQRAGRRASMMEAAVLAMSPAEARRRLAEWAEIKGRTQTEVDALNSKVSNDKRS